MIPSFTLVLLLALPGSQNVTTRTEFPGFPTLAACTQSLNEAMDQKAKFEAKGAHLVGALCTQK